MGLVSLSLNTFQIQTAAGEKKYQFLVGWVKTYFSGLRADLSPEKPSPVPRTISGIETQQTIQLRVERNDEKAHA